MARWFAFRGTVRLPGLIEQPDRTRAQAEAAQRFGPSVTVQSVASFEIADERVAGRELPGLSLEEDDTE